MLKTETEEQSTAKIIQLLKKEKLITKKILSGIGVKTKHLETLQEDITHMEFYKNCSLTSSDDGSVVAIDMFTGERKFFCGHTGGVWAFSANKNLFATGSTDKSVRMWDFNAGIQIKMLTGHKSTVRVIKIANDMILSGGRDGDIRVWDRKGNNIFVLQGHSESVRTMDVLGDYLVSGSYDGAVILWNFKNGRMVRRLIPHRQRVYSVLITPNYIISGGQDAIVQISQRASNQTLLLNLNRGIVAYLTMAYSNGKEKFLITGGSDGVVGIFKVDSGTLVHKIVFRKLISAICVYKDYLFVGVDTCVKLYKINSGSFVRTILGGVSQVYKIVVSGDIVLIGYKSGKCIVMSMDFCD